MSDFARFVLLYLAGLLLYVAAPFAFFEGAHGRATTPVVGEGIA